MKLPVNHLLAVTEGFMKERKMEGRGQNDKPPEFNSFDCSNTREFQLE